MARSSHGCNTPALAGEKFRLLFKGEENRARGKRSLDFFKWKGPLVRARTRAAKNQNQRGPCKSNPRAFQGALHFSSKTDEWSTPNDFFARLDLEFKFELDPCATKENAKCNQFYTKSEDGLSKDWGKHIVFMNPPYGRHIEYWMRKALLSSLQGATVVALVPARTDTRWWHEYAAKGEIRFLKGRLKFGGALHAAPFPSAVVIFRPSSPAQIKKETKRSFPGEHRFLSR